MYCLANNCYVCLENKNNLNDINSSLSMNKDIIHIIDYLPCNLALLKTMRILLICEECCVRLRETCLFRKKCLKNSTQLQGYMDKLNTTPISNTANEAQLNMTHADSYTKCKIRSEDEIYSFQWQPNIEDVNSEDSLVKEWIICKQEVDEKQNRNSTELIEESEDVFVNLEVYFSKEKNTWKREGIGDMEEYPTNNISTVNMDNESYSHCVSSEFTQVHATNKNHLNTASKKSFQCLNYCKSFFTKSALILHSRIHTDEKTHECAIWKTRFSQKAKFIIYTRVHTPDLKSFNCSRCNKCFSATPKKHHEKPYSGSICKKCLTII